MTDDLRRELDRCRDYVMSEEEKRQQRRSFCYGMQNWSRGMTREEWKKSVDKFLDALEAEEDAAEANLAITLSDRDRDRFVAALEGGKGPNEALRNAVESYRRNVLSPRGEK